MKKIIFLIFASLFLMHYVYAQDCPKVNTLAPFMVKDGEVVSFMSDVSNLKPDVNVTYNWTVSAGSIESGQGMSMIMVNTKGLWGKTITATVEVGGFPRGCSSTSSSTTIVEAGATQTVIYIKDNYMDTNAFSEAAEMFAKEIMSESRVATSSKAVIYLYPGKNAKASAEIQDMTKTIKAALAKHGMKSTMYQIKTGAKTEQSSWEMWIVPKGGKTPEAIRAEWNK